MERVGIGLDIGGSKTLLAVMDSEGQLLYKNRFSSSKKVEFVQEVISESLSQGHIAESQVSALGIGIPGMTNHLNGIVIDAPALGWRNLNLIEKIQPRFSFPVFLNNDVNCALLGERWLGTAADSDPLIYISIGTGLGSAIFANGSLVYGSGHMAGEIGFWLEKEDALSGKKNEWGQFGVSEYKISGSALTKSFASGEKFFDLLKKRSPMAQKVMDDLILNLSLMIANLTSFLNPKKIILGGGVSESLDDYLAEIQSQVNQLTPIPVEIQCSSLKNEAAAIGAIAYAFGKADNGGS